MRTSITLFFFFFSVQLFGQKSTFENINDAASTLISIFGKKKDSNSIVSNNDRVIQQKLSDDSKNIVVCKELCIRSYNKKNTRIELKNKKTLENIVIAVMSKDKSCIFDINTGIYVLQIFIDDKIVKSSEVRIINDIELIEIPDI